MKTLFSVLLSLIFLNSFSQADSIKNKLSIGISPLLFLSPTSDIFFVEFRPTRRFSIEVGGGVHGLFWSPFYGSGFTVRSGMKIYNSKKIGRSNSYHELLVFYRQLKYENEYYYDNNYKYHVTWGEGATKTAKGDETRNVIGVEWLTGRKIFLGKEKYFVMEYYGGLGVRVKLRAIAINEVYGTYTGQDPPFQEHINEVLPSLHFGIKFATN